MVVFLICGFILIALALIGREWLLNKERRRLFELFDHMGREGASEDEWQAHKAFVFDVGNAFLSSYLPLVHANVDRPFTAQEREWQLHRRGRYVEFNLVWDRGTRFGLVSNGRTESILMSLPPEVRWP